MIIVDGPLRAAIDPARGGKIVSLRDAAGVEWLAQPLPGIPAPPRGTLFTDAEMSGWDECAPTIADALVDGRPAPDHGDLWDAPFEVVGPGAVEGIGESFGYRLRREARATADGLELLYRAEALERRIPFLWAAHPQFIASPGARVVVDGGADEVVDVHQEGWPRVAGETGIDTVEPGGSRKWLVPPERPAQWARLERPGVGALDLTWSAEAPYLGVWFDAGAYSREPVIAIEPSTAYFDNVATAIALERVPWLVPGIPLEWRMTLRATTWLP